MVLPLNSSIPRTAGQCINAAIATKKKEEEKGEGRMYWLHSLLMTVTSGFSGGFIAPLLIGKQPIPFGNDYIFVCLFVSWAVVHNLNGRALLETDAVKCVWTLFVGLFRTHTVINMTLAANAAIAASKYEGMAFFGPIFTASFLGSCGLFFPPRPDFWASIKYGCPWPMQGAIITATATHILINDTDGPIGNAVRTITGDVSLETLRLVIAAMHLSNIFGAAFITPNFNIFSQFHFYMYAFMPHVQGPKDEPGVLKKKVKSQENLSFSMPLASKESVERTFEMGRLSLFFVFVAYLLQTYLLQPTYLAAGYANGLTVGAPGLGRCQLVPFLRHCKSYEMDFSKNTDDTYKLEVQGGDLAKPFKASGKGAGVEGTVKAYLSKDGSLKIGSCSKDLWSSAKKCPASTSDAPNFMSLSDGGVPTVFCSDGSTIIL